LESVRKQSFQDFEVVLSDNALRRQFEPDPRIFDGLRVRYVRPPAPVWMTDHYEFAVGQARGRYVGVLGDKSLLVSQALEQVAAEIRKDSPDVVSWRTGAFLPSGSDLAGPGVVTMKRAPDAKAVKVPPAEALDYLLATYLEPDFVADHQLETRGSIYHGVFSAELVAAMKARYGRVFQFYAPDLNAQCAAMQIAKDVTHVNRTLELVMSGPSNGIAVGLKASQVLATLQDAAQGASGVSQPLIPDISASIAHLLASDLVALSGRTLGPKQWVELHRKTAFDLYRLEDWPDPAFRGTQFRALQNSLARLGLEVPNLLLREKWNARRSKARWLVGKNLRPRFGTSIDAFRRILGRMDRSLEKRSFDHVFAALASQHL
jgi:hypothetical protein